MKHLISGGGDTIVDFCAGGVSILRIPLYVEMIFCHNLQGHLGIALAHSCPQCQVRNKITYLITHFYYTVGNPC